MKASLVDFSHPMVLTAPFICRRGVAMTAIIRGVLAIWLVVVFLLGAAGAFARPPGALPIPIFIGATVPLVVFLGA